MKKNKKFLILFPFLLFFFVSCDFTPTINQDILKAQKKISTQKYQEAVNIYENILKGAVPLDLRIKIYYQLGEVCSIHLGEVTKAIYYYGKITEYSDNPLWQVKVEEKTGELYFNFLQDYQKSAEVFSRLTSFTPQLKRFNYYQFMLGLSYLNGAKHDEAVEVFNKIESSAKSEFQIRSYYYLGLTYFHNKDWVKSIQYFKEYIKRESRKDYIVQAKFLMANAYETIENLKSAYDIYYSLMDEYPNIEVLQNRLKSIYERRVARKR